MALDIKDLEERFRDDLEHESENRNYASEDIAFGRLGEQWPDSVKRDREREGRPCLTINRMPSFIRQVVNDSRINSPQIKVKPVDDDADPETAEILSGLIRNIEYVSQAEVAYDTALESAVSCGMGFFKVATDYDDESTFAQSIFIRRITNPLSIVFDSRSESLDGSDWMHAAEIEWLKKSEFERKYPGADPMSFAGTEVDGITRDSRSDDVRIASYWVIEDEPEQLLMLSDGMVISQSEFTKRRDDLGGASMRDVMAELGVQVVRERKSSKRRVKQYICGADIIEVNDWAGKYIPIIPVFGEEVFHKGKRILKSLVRDARDPQRMYNYWRTASTELVALAPKTPFIGPVGAFDTDAKKWATANVKSHAYLEYDGSVPPQRQPFVGVPAGAIQEALNASDDMKAITGLYDASLGARSNETSGRAINARKLEGDVSTFHFIDNKNKSIAHCGRVLIDLIPKIYDTERVIRIIGHDGETQNVPLKQETQVKGVRRVFDFGVGKYDVAVDTGPSFTTQREEAATQMTELLRTFPQAAPLIGDLVAKAMNWPDAEEIAKRLKTLLPPQIQALDNNELPPEVAIRMQQLEAQHMARVQQLEMQLAQMNQAMQQGIEQYKKIAGEHEAMKASKEMEARKLEIESFKAETDRIKVNSEIAKAQAEMALAIESSQNKQETRGPVRKEITIQAPSGNVYTGLIIEDELVVNAPNGNYTGTIKTENANEQS